MLRSHFFFLGALSLLALPACDRDSSEPSAQAAQETPPPLAERAEPAADLLGVTWEWVSTLTPVERIEAQNPERYTLRLQADGKAVLQFDCNRGGGNYELAGNQLKFGPLISTRMACPPDTQDSVFMSELQRITSYFVQEGDLFLEMPADSGTMRFRRANDQN